MTDNIIQLRPHFNAALAAVGAGNMNAHLGVAPDVDWYNRYYALRSSIKEVRLAQKATNRDPSPMHQRMQQVLEHQLDAILGLCTD